MIRHVSKEAKPMSQDDPQVDRYRPLMARIAQETTLDGLPLRTIGVTSAEQGEGVSTVAANLASIEANLNAKDVLLVNASEKLSRQSKKRGPIFSKATESDSEENLLLDIKLNPTKQTNLWTADLAPQGAELATASALDRRQTFLHEALSRFDLVIFDLAPAQASSSCLNWATLLDGLVLVVQANKTSIPAAMNAKRRLIKAQANLVGAVLNECTD